MEPSRDKPSALSTEIPLLLAVFFVGTDFVAAKYALESFAPLALVAVRFTIAGLLLCAAAAILEPGGRPGRRGLLPTAGLGVVGVTLNQGLYVGGLDLTTGSNAALAFATSPVWGLVLGAALGLERPGKGAVIGVLVSLFEVGLVVREGLGSPRRAPRAT